MKAQQSTIKFQADKFQAVQAEYWYNKPQGGFWTSSKKESGKSDWIEWCEKEEPNWLTGNIYEYEVSPEARVLNGFAAVKMYSSKISEYRYIFDWERMIADGWHGLQFEYEYFGTAFKGWDVESTIWFDPSVLKLVE